MNICQGFHIVIYTVMSYLINYNPRIVVFYVLEKMPSHTASKGPSQSFSKALVRSTIMYCSPLSPRNHLQCLRYILGLQNIYCQFTDRESIFYPNKHCHFYIRKVDKH